MAVQVAVERETYVEQADASENNQENNTTTSQQKHEHTTNAASTHSNAIRAHSTHSQHVNPQQQRYQEHVQQLAQQNKFENQKESTLIKIKTFANECFRVFRITKKPTAVEFKTIVKVSGIGMLAIGLLGFLIQLVRQLIYSIK